MKLLVAAVVGMAFGGLCVWFSQRAGSETMLGLMMALVLIEGFYQGWARFEENEKAKVFRNEMRRRLDQLEHGQAIWRAQPEVSRSEME